MRRIQQPALVAVENGKPQRVSWSSVSNGRVARVIDEWRVAGRWWATELRRDYYLVELDGGRLIELYREGERWCVTGIAD